MSGPHSDLNYYQALVSGKFEEFPIEKKNELQQQKIATLDLVDCGDLNNFHRKCAEFKDPNGVPVYSYCDDRGVCARLFLRLIR